MSDPDEPRELILSDMDAMRMLGVPFGAFMGLFLGGSGCLVGGLMGLPLGPCALLTAAVGLVFGGVGGGAFTGVIYGGLMALFLSAMRKDPLLVAWEDDEAVRVTGPGARVLDKQVGGWFHLTDRRLRFVPHADEKAAQEVSWPVSDILDAETAKSLGIFENRLVLTMADGTTETFVLAEPEEWKAELAALQLAG